MFNRDGDNDLVFEILSIKDKYDFIRSVVGYTPREGVFPCLKTKEDFIKVLDALNKEYDRQFGTTKQFGSEEYINPKDLKDGDYIYIENKGFKAIYIFKSFANTKINRYVYYDLTNNQVYILNGYTTYTKDIKIRKATNDEIQTLNNALLVQKRLFWNPISKQLEKTGLLVDTATNKIIADKDPNYYDYYCGSEQPLTPSESISNISIKTFIKSKKHYQLNFNN
jgi:hypothetical protein